MTKSQPRIKATFAPGLTRDDDRIVVQVKNARDQDQFERLLDKIRSLPGRRFDFEERHWHVPATPEHARAVLGLGPVEVAPLLRAWIADNDYRARLAAIEDALALVGEKLGLPPFEFAPETPIPPEPPASPRLTDNQEALLRQIRAWNDAEHEPAGVPYLMRATGFSKQGVASNATSLARKGLIDRSNARNTDPATATAWVSVYAITAAGRACLPD